MLSLACAALLLSLERFAALTEPPLPETLALAHERTSVTPESTAAPRNAMAEQEATTAHDGTREAGPLAVAPHVSGSPAYDSLAKAPEAAGALLEGSATPVPTASAANTGAATAASAKSVSAAVTSRSRERRPLVFASASSSASRSDKVVDIRPQPLLAPASAAPATTLSAPLAPAPAPTVNASTSTSTNTSTSTSTAVSTPSASSVPSASPTATTKDPRSEPTRAPVVVVSRRLARAQIDALSVRGSLVTGVVRRAATRLVPRWNDCVARAQARAPYAGAATTSRVALVIDERGRAHTVSANGAALPGLDACVAEAAAQLVCDESPDTGTVSVSWNVVFTP
jgi:hypothetical protein